MGLISGKLHIWMYAISVRLDTLENILVVWIGHLFTKCIFSML